MAAFPVEDPEAMIRAVSAGSPVVLAGDGEGLVDASAAGLLSGGELLLYSASLAEYPDLRRRELTRPGTRLVLTDTNRRAARRWGTVHENSGYTEPAGEEPLRFDPTDNRLPLFPEATDEATTVAQHRGGVTARATAYGNPITFTPEDRAANAVDDDPSTAWSVGGFSAVDGERIELRYRTARTTDRFTLTQVDNGVQNRWITRVRVRLDEDEPFDLDLGQASRTPSGQTIGFGRRSFSTLSVEILATDAGRRDRYDNLSAVGFSDIRLAEDDRRLDEVLRLPRDLLQAAGTSSADQPLDIVLTRRRSRPTAALRDDEERSLARAFRLPTARAFTVSGQARLSHRAADRLIDDLVDVTTLRGQLVATSSRRLPGDIRARAVSAIDGDRSTRFSPGFLGQVGDFVRYRLDQPITFDRMDLSILNDGRHSVPTRIRIDADGRAAAGVDIPDVADQKVKDGTTTVPLRFPAVTGREITIAIEEIREVVTNDWLSEEPVIMPVGLAELGIPGLRVTVPEKNVDDACRSDLLTLDGRALPVRIGGTVADAVAGAPLRITGCGPAVRAAAGDHLLRSADGREIGLDVDQLLLSSPGEGASGTASGPDSGTADGADADAAPGLVVTDNGRDRITLEVGPRSTDTWVVLSQSHSLGWSASAEGRDLGEPVPVNGFANAWLVPAGGDTLTVELEWVPQRVVRWSILASVLVAVICAAIVLLHLRRGRRSGAVSIAPTPGDQPRAFAPSVLWRSSGAAPSIASTVSSTVLVAVATALVIGPVAGLIVGGAAFATLRWRRARVLTVVGPAATLAASGLFIIVSQLKNSLPSGFDWPGYFSEVHQVAFVGVALLAVDVVVERLWTGRWWSRTDADRATDPPGPGSVR
ncbi:MAG: hypothetical protein WKF43_10765 [Acidimicrobiales bacterium]